MSTLHTQLWLNTIEEVLRPNWEILTKIAKNDSINVNKFGLHRKVYIPNAGEDAKIHKNSVPVSGSTRTDTAVEYNVDVFRAEPITVTREDALSVSYDKINSIVESMFGGIGESAMYDIFKNWTHTGQTKVTFTGTTDVKAILDAKSALDKQKVPATNRILLLNATHANELLTNLTTNDSNISFVNNDGLMILNRMFMGFQVVQLPYVVEFSSGTTTPVAFNEVGTDDVNNIPVSLAFHKDMVSVAKDDTHIFYDENNAKAFGDIISGEAFLGGKYRRNDLKGVVQIYKA